MTAESASASSVARGCRVLTLLPANPVARYDPVLDLWEPVASLKTPRSGIAAAVLSGACFLRTCYSLHEALQTRMAGAMPHSRSPTPALLL